LKATGPKCRRTPIKEVPSIITSSPISSCFPLVEPGSEVFFDEDANRLAIVGVGKAGTAELGVIEPLLGVEGWCEPPLKDCLSDTSDRLGVKDGMPVFTESFGDEGELGVGRPLLCCALLFIVVFLSPSIIIVFCPKLGNLI